MKLSLQSKYKLNDGSEIPVLGFGTYELEGENAYRAVKWALEAGYRHIDSAEWYENEQECGRAILDYCNESGVSRADIFYTTKLKHNAGIEATRKAIDLSLELCGLGYIDLYLIHGPWGGPEARRQAWEACVAAQKEGKVKSIGISTFGLRHMRELFESGLPLPSVHQIDLHPFMTRTEIVEFCKDKGVVLEAWAALARTMRFEHPLIVSLSKKYEKGPAHIFLRYSLQKGFVPLVKSADRVRIVSNANVFDFELDLTELAQLDQLDESNAHQQKQKDLVTDWDPTDCP
ncbi:aldo-keto reductase [Multifurca ochricompacta]|uniref:Aldo-keto reductase n=1 Tax=Multifurca ochricompacta TaxID=376703 RepID=A0AAD4LZ70_9AGAM|nr:aldo-keto reductase [Multifurca ochricompacta]